MSASTPSHVFWSSSSELVVARVHRGRTCLLTGVLGAMLCIGISKLVSATDAAASANSKDSEGALSRV